jgi:hypothetical protein
MKTKTPNLESAVVTARVISRLMRKAGFLMANTDDRHRWTEGFHVSRVGCSQHISIGYHTEGHMFPPAPDVQARRSEAWKKLEAFLTERGYIRDTGYSGYWIKCERAE